MSTKLSHIIPSLLLLFFVISTNGWDQSESPPECPYPCLPPPTSVTNCPPPPPSPPTEPVVYPSPPPPTPPYLPSPAFPSPYLPFYPPPYVSFPAPPPPNPILPYFPLVLHNTAVILIIFFVFSFHKKAWSFACNGSCRNQMAHLKHKEIQITNEDYKIELEWDGHA
ncbi:classical arabinogalactan protein 4-like [Dioscorea cayenensis subsp. rotundata]|uniref:Classical arabinogalactan protein 4-like n=1 Tax=Dioscorea cayennensis subsp. rotundata TaxID=55577 RepID=A0AB40AVX2_DIOCR|nr:classical arabinogalactan protein 4-like [Dioscorea cayenensis subsp. rotundata]